MSKEKHVQLTDFFTLLESRHKGEYNFKILNGIKENNGLDFKIIQIKATSRNAYEYLSSIVSTVDFDLVYPETRCIKNYHTSLLTIRIIILDEKLEDCGLKLVNVTDKECRELCQDFYMCKRYKQSTYKVEIEAKRTLEPCVSVKDSVSIHFTAESYFEAQKVMNTIKEAFFNGAKDLTSSVCHTY